MENNENLSLLSFPRIGKHLVCVIFTQRLYLERSSVNFAAQFAANGCTSRRRRGGVRCRVGKTSPSKCDLSCRAFVESDEFPWWREQSVEKACIIRENSIRLYSNTFAHHSHFRKVEETVGSKVGRSLFDEWEIGQVHAEIGYAGWIGAMECLSHDAKASVRANNCLQFLDGRFNLFGRGKKGEQMFARSIKREGRKWNSLHS